MLLCTVKLRFEIVPFAAVVQVFSGFDMMRRDKSLLMALFVNSYYRNRYFFLQLRTLMDRLVGRWSSLQHKPPPEKERETHNNPFSRLVWLLKSGIIYPEKTSRSIGFRRYQRVPYFVYFACSSRL